MKYALEIQKVLQFIEIHLYEELSLEQLAEVATFSKFHFHKIFKQQVGQPVSHYIRSRRIANSARLLLFSTMRVIDISLISGFHSQEAFTRAFKEYYGVPPYQYRKQFNLIQKRGNKMQKQIIKGWFISGCNIDKFTTNYDEVIFHQGSRSVNICSKSDLLAAEDFSTLMQQFSAKDFLGKRMKLSAFIKNEISEGWAGLWMRVDGQGMRQLKFDNMQDRPIVGTSEWCYYDSVLDIPINAEVINIGILFQGQGNIWADSITFQEVDPSVATTDFSAETLYPTAPENLSFEA